MVGCSFIHRSCFAVQYAYGKTGPDFRRVAFPRARLPRQIYYSKVFAFARSFVTESAYVAPLTCVSVTEGDLSVVDYAV
jgi:hypothetical protein